MRADPFELERFVAAQAGVFEIARAEVAAGAKRSHWMWFVFPQIAGLGASPMAQRYAIASVAEARAFLAHPVLGPRLREITAIANALAEHDPARVFGRIDAIKLRSCLTLFEVAEPGGVFAEGLVHWFSGDRDPATLARVD